DGKYVYYLDHQQNGIGDVAALMRIPAEGGEETRQLDGIHGVMCWLTRKGIYFLTRDHGVDYINLWRPDSGSRELVGRLPFHVSTRGRHREVTDDGRWLITGETNRNESDLMFIENFR